MQKQQVNKWQSVEAKLLKVVTVQSTVCFLCCPTVFV